MFNNQADSNNNNNLNNNNVESSSFSPNTNTKKVNYILPFGMIEPIPEIKNKKLSQSKDHVVNINKFNNFVKNSYNGNPSMINKAYVNIYSPKGKVNFNNSFTNIVPENKKVDEVYSVRY